MTAAYQPGDKVYCLCGATWWEYKPLEWHKRANTGCDFEGHRLTATVEGDRLRVQHGDNPEAVRWYSLDELNDVGGTTCAHADGRGCSTLAWCDEIDRQMGGVCA